MSRPNESEPMRKRCWSVSPSSVVISPVAPGSRSRLPASNSDGSTVPSQGAASATTSSAARMLAPMRTDQFARTRDRIFLIPDPRIERDVGQVDEQVDEHVYEREEQDHALDGREVA